MIKIEKKKKNYKKLRNNIKIKVYFYVNNLLNYLFK